MEAVRQILSLKINVHTPAFPSTVLFPFILLLCASSAAGQTRPGEIRGRVVTADSIPITHAHIQLQDLATVKTSGQDGTFRFPEILAGTYSLIVTCQGYARFVVQCTVVPDQAAMVVVVLRDSLVQLHEIVVTATRSERVLEEVPIPTMLVDKSTIDHRSLFTLGDLLAEVNGMAVSSNQWGSGVQVEGLDPAYTLILVDGEPLIGRTAGTLELSRVSLGNVEHVEIVRGPSSSLHGSEALAGVINVVTHDPAGPLQGSASLRYGRFNALRLTAGIEGGSEAAGGALYLARTSSDGYTFHPELPGLTAPRYTDYTLSPKLLWAPGALTRILLSGRGSFQAQSNVATVQGSGESTFLDDRATLTDWSATGRVTHRFAPMTKLEGSIHHARFVTQADLHYPGSGLLYSEDRFTQDYTKAEAQLDFALSGLLPAILGAGIVRETVLADRIAGQEHSARSAFIFAQQEWMPRESIDLIGSVRMDWHSNYATHVSPKLAAMVRPHPWMRVGVSLGSGFKAPTFQQLFLDFTNPQVGYSVYGAAMLNDAYLRLAESGQLQSVLVDPSAVSTIRPEQSIAFNASLDLTTGALLSLHIRGYYNDLSNLIEAAPFATKTNGQPVYTYFNINRMFTRGFDVEVAAQPLADVAVSVTYSYLEAKDRGVLDDVRAGVIVKTGSTGRLRPVQEVEYGGLFNRSRHSGTLAVTHENSAAGLTIALRGTYRGRYGYADANGNTILDDDTEYAPGFFLWNITCSKSLWDSLMLQVGVENALDWTDPEHAPYLPGRVAFAGVAVTFR
jgi:outer membrane receptor for ferrienterochelin and colicins